MNASVWHRSISQPIWTLTRITRRPRVPLEPLDVDARLLGACAMDQQGLLIDRCDAQQAAAMLDAAGTRMGDGLAWVIGASDRIRDLILTRLRQQDSWIHDRMQQFRDATTWMDHEYRLLLTSAEELRATSRYNLRRRSDAIGHFCPFIAVVDPAMTLCERCRNGWDPAWVIRDVASRLCAVQHAVPIIIFTARDLITLSPSTVQKSFGLSGLLYWGNSRLDAELRGDGN